MNRFNGYTSIKINVDGNVDKRITTIRFNKKWTNEKIKNWLYENDYPIESDNIRICTPYDCSGQVHKINFVLKNQVATITEYFDV